MTTDANPVTWHIVTCEFPPQIGGVADYTFRIASSLAASGELVVVWCPRGLEMARQVPGVEVNNDLGRFSLPDLLSVGRLLKSQKGPRRILLQWVPHGYGWKGMNVPFCLWILKRSTLNRDSIEITVHEPFLPLEGPIKLKMVSIVQRIMLSLLLLSADKVWITSMAWEPFIRSLSVRKRLPVSWLPVPSTLPEFAETASANRLANEGQVVVGHFGAYDEKTRKVLRIVIPRILGLNQACFFHLMGRGSSAVGSLIGAEHPELCSRIRILEAVSEEELRRQISACDVLVQPYTGGVTTRRTSVMAALACGVATVATSGVHTEEIWKATNAVILVPEDDVDGMIRAVEDLLGNDSLRADLGAKARELYRQHFSVSRILSRLRGSEVSESARKG